MGKRRRKPAPNYFLKTAILQHSGTQRKFGLRYGWGETRLSEIIHRRGGPAADDEKHKLARQLGKSVAELFPPDLDPGPAVPSQPQPAGGAR